MRAGSQGKRGGGSATEYRGKGEAAAAPFVAGGRFSCALTAKVRRRGCRQRKKGADVTAVRGPVQNEQGAAGKDGLGLGLGESKKRERKKDEKKNNWYTVGLGVKGQGGGWA